MSESTIPADISVARPLLAQKFGDANSPAVRVTCCCGLTDAGAFQFPVAFKTQVGGQLVNLRLPRTIKKKLSSAPRQGQSWPSFSPRSESAIYCTSRQSTLQSGMGFGWNLLAGTKPLYRASCCKTRHMPRTVSRDLVAKVSRNFQGGPAPT